MAALGLDSKLDRAPELPDVPWPSSAAYAGAQVPAAGRWAPRGVRAALERDGQTVEFGRGRGEIREGLG